MSTNLAKAAKIAATFKSRLYPPKAGALSELVESVPQLLSYRKNSGPLDAGMLRFSAEMSKHLAILAEALKSDSTVRLCLEALLKLGRSGAQSAVRFVCGNHIDLDRLTSIVSSLPECSKLHLMNELLRIPPRHDKKIMLWAREVLTPLVNCDVKQGLRFLRDIDMTGDRPGFLVRETLISGTLPEKMVIALGNKLDAKSLENMARCSRALRHPEVSTALGRHVLDHDVNLTPVTLEILVWKGSGASGAEAGALIRILKRNSGDLTPNCIRALTYMGRPKIGRVAALAYAKYPSLQDKIAAVSALFPANILHRFLQELAPEMRTKAVRKAFETMCAMAPKFVAEFIDRATTDGSLEESSARTAAQHLESFRSALINDPIPAMPEPRSRPDNAGGDIKKFFTRLVSDKKTIDLAEVISRTHSPRDMDLPGAILESTEYASRTMSKLNLQDAWFDEVSLHSVTILGCSLSDAALNHSTFDKSTFSNVRFDSAFLNTCEFISCTFDKCDFSGTTIGSCKFTDCSFTSSIFTDTLVRDCTFNMCKMNHNAMAGCTLHLTRFQSCDLIALDLSAGLLYSSALMGCDLQGCVMNGTSIIRSSLECTTMKHCTLARCTIIQVDSPISSLMRAKAEYLVQLSLSDKHDNLLNSKIFEALDQSFLEATLVSWAVKREQARIEQHMLRNNERRLSWAVEKMGADKSDLFHMLPHLLNSNIFETAMNVAKVPPCSVLGYHPSQRALALTAKHFPKTVPSEPRGRHIVIKGIYTIGSTGSVAQGPESDVDYWVCYDPVGVTDEMLRGLADKLDALTDWARTTFGQEMYFFAMSLDKVRKNDFGLSGRESSGSAQALLLKAEFYRTAILIAGQEPAWWIMPPGGGDRDYRTRLPGALAYPSQSENRTVDLGPLAAVPPAEFFGGSLWQIVKAIHQPYKSVLKLGLLERYANSRQASGLMLADEIKANLMARREETSDIDPYVIMFRELRNYYASIKDEDAGRLLMESLTNKTHLESYDFFFGCPMRFEEKSLLEYLFGPGKAVRSSVDGLTGRWNFSKSIKIGGTVSRFMINAYKRIQSRLPKEKGMNEGRMTPEDMTRLGRKIAVNFAVRENKINRVPFLGVKDGVFPELHFSAQKAHGKRPVWVVQGKAHKEGKVSVKDMQILKTDINPIRLMTWLVINKLFTPSALVHADRSIAPLSVVEIKLLLEALWNFFPIKETFEVDMERYLGTEIVEKALFIMNLTAPQDLNQIADTCVVYSTNWGEIHCIQLEGAGPQIRKCATACLKEAIPQKVASTISLKSFVPKRSQCPRFKLT